MCGRYERAAKLQKMCLLPYNFFYMPYRQSVFYQNTFCFIQQIQRRYGFQIVNTAIADQAGRVIGMGPIRRKFRRTVCHPSSSLSGYTVRMVSRFFLTISERISELLI